MLKGMGVDLAAVNRLRPWNLAMLLTTQKYMELGFDADLGVDMHFLKRAKEGNKQILELESIERQLKLFASLAEGKEDAYLYYSLLELKDVPDFAKRLAPAWKSGDAKAVDALIRENLDKQPEFKEFGVKLFDERNKAMAERIAALLQTDRSCLVVVGAGHLVGEAGIVNLLQKRGFSVEQQ